MNLDLETAARIHCAPLSEVFELWREVAEAHGREGERWLCRVDRYYLLVMVMSRVDAIHPWLYDRCREVERDTDGYLDLWAREHYKSTIITLAGILQEIIRDPEITVCIFSHTKGVARKFLAQLKLEMETNTRLQDLFPDVFYQEPGKQSPCWSLDRGLQVIRKTNPKEQTVEAYGLVDGMPTGGHYRLRVYDDVVTPESVSTPDQVEKTTEAWSLSDNLGAVTVLPDGREVMRRWHIGTRYSFADTYQHIIDGKKLRVRKYPATHDGTMHGRPVFMSEDVWKHKLATQLEKDIACQMLLDPRQGNQAMFRKEWLRFTDVRPATLIVYILCDPASSKEVGRDRTGLPVIGIDAQHNRYLLDGYNHKMSLSERWRAIKTLRRKWMAMPGVQAVFVGYERFGIDSDLDYMKEQMVIDKEAFEIVELSFPRDANVKSKDDRVQRLEPDFKNSKFWLAALNDKGETRRQQAMRKSGQAFRIFEPTRQKDENGQLYSLNARFIEQYLTYPFSTFKDLIDAVSRIYDMDILVPEVVDQAAVEPEAHAD